MVVLYLAVQQHVAALSQPLDEIYETDFGSIAHAAEHRLSHKRATESHAVETTGEFTVVVSLHAVSLASVVKTNEAVYDPDVYPGLSPVGARPDHGLEVLIHANLVGIFTNYPRQRLRDVQLVQLYDAARVGAVEFDPSVAVGHRKSSGPVADFEDLWSQSHAANTNAVYNMRAMSEIERTSRNSSRAVRSYSVTPDQLLAALGRVIERLPRWKIESTSAKSLEAMRQTRLFHFKDDVKIQVSDQDGGRSRATFESASRIGKGDLGQNSRNLEELLRVLDEELESEDRASI